MSARKIEQEGATRDSKVLRNRKCQKARECGDCPPPGERGFMQPGGFGGLFCQGGLGQATAMVAVPRQALLELSVAWDFWEECCACSQLQDSVATLEQAKC